MVEVFFMCLQFKVQCHHRPSLQSNSRSYNNSPHSHNQYQMYSLNRWVYYKQVWNKHQELQTNCNKFRSLFTPQVLKSPLEAYGFDDIRHSTVIFMKIIKLKFCKVLCLKHIKVVEEPAKIRHFFQLLDLHCDWFLYTWNDPRWLLWILHSLYLS